MMIATFLHFPTLERAWLGAYYVVLLLLAVYGIHRLVIVALYQFGRSSAPRELNTMKEWPRVTVQLPLFNELYVAERLLEAAAAIDYPAERLDIQVLDDSTDRTYEIVARKVAELRRRGVAIVHLHRTDRQGFKAGALAAGLGSALGEFICVFDADFLPPRDLLKRSLPHFGAPEVGMVQARWTHLNRDYSLLSRAQALQLDAHFVIEHAARNRSGRFFNFNGTAGIWRRETIEDAGNWQHDTLTEDLDLSYRAQVRGWRFIYLNHVEAPAELPVQISGLRSQRHRWTKGAVQTARKMLGRVWHSPVPLRAKIEATFHLTANFNYPLNLILSVLIFPAMLIRMKTGFEGFLVLDLPVFLCGTLSVYAYYLLAQRELGRLNSDVFKSLPGLILMDTGLAVNNTKAVLEGFKRGTGEFVRTPKFSLARTADDWIGKAYRGGDSWIYGIELAIGLYFSVTVVVAIQLGMWPALPFLVLYQAGYLYIGLLSFIQRRRETNAAVLASS
jgi:cellulose synthase/poly-beta-1,6-N-acetylglucosamine synthase-like glycosyltransferase|tara:strand:+ start:275 stop:1783 length:1509 start_codon:yes stop_codon:yes gene_type:complete